MSSDIPFLSATQLNEAYKSRQLSPVEVVKVTLERIEKLQPSVNAFVTVCADDALLAAKHAEANLRSDGAAPLTGVPFSVKDLLPTKGLRTTYGSPVFSENIPVHDAIAVQRLKQAGAILVGKTTTPAIGHKAITTSLVSGISRNPWNLKHSCGGSSGGAAAAVASGQGPLAIGTDGGGSVRIPASACGITGLKPTLGCIPQETSSDLFGTLSYIGPMARTVRDTALMFSVMKGPERSDPWAIGQSISPNSFYEKLETLKGDFKAAWFPFLGNSILDCEVKNTVENAISVLCDLGLDIVLEKDVLLPGDKIWRTIAYAAQYARMEEHLKTAPALIDPTLKQNLLEGKKVSGVELQKAIFERSNIYRAIEKIFCIYDIIITPTLAAPAPIADFDAHDEFFINKKSAGKLRAAWYPYTHPFNISGHPALTVPCGWTKGDLPVGLQLIAPWYQEELLFQIASLYEECCPWTDAWPNL